MIIHDLYLSQMQTTDGTVLTLLVGLALMYFDLEDCLALLLYCSQLVYLQTIYVVVRHSYLFEVVVWLQLKHF